MLLTRSVLVVGCFLLAVLGPSWVWSMEVDLDGQVCGWDCLSDPFCHEGESDDCSADEDLGDPNDGRVTAIGCSQSSGNGGSLGGGGETGPGELDYYQGGLNQQSSRERLRNMSQGFGGGSGGECDWPDDYPNPGWPSQPWRDRSGLPGDCDNEDYPEPAACFREGGVEDGWDSLQRPPRDDDRICTPIVPEPITISLLALGGGYLLRRRRV